MATRQQASRQSYLGSLTALENDPRFSSSGGGGGLTPTAVQTGNYVATSGKLVLVDASGGSLQVTAPSAPSAGTTFAVKRLDSGTTTVTVVSGTAALIDGDTSLVLAGLGSGATMIYDGSGWQISATAIVGAGTMDAASALQAPIYTVGNWFDRRSASPVLNTLSSQANATSAVAINTCFYLPVFAHRQVSIDTVGVMVGTTAPTTGAAVRIGSYLMSAAGAPSGAPRFDSGSLSLGISASTPVTGAVSTTLPKGWSFLAVAFNATNPGSMYCLSMTATLVPNIGHTALGTVATVFQTPPFYSEVISGGVLPTAPAPTPYLTAAASASVDVFFRVVG